MLIRFISGLAAMSMLTACLSPKPYVDPKYATVDYQSVAVTPQSVTVATTFTREGKPIKRAQKLLQENVEEILTKAGYTLVEEGAEASFDITFNNVPEEGAFGKGFGTGLTLGLAGTAVSDFYEVTISHTQGDVAVQRDYGHAIHSTIGNAAAPIANVAASANIPEAFYSMVEDVVLQFLIDMETGADEQGEPVAFLPIFVPERG